MDKLGKMGRDKITGFEGTITGKCTYLYGCSQYCLVPKVSKDGTIGATQWFDEGRIEITGKGILAKEVKSEKNGAEFNVEHPIGFVIPKNRRK